MGDLVGHVKARAVGSVKIVSVTGLQQPSTAGPRGRSLPGT
jgi:hypothetical protein